jgi:prepilin-type N-terminal cleavage/methylation domain-containing protein
VIVLRQRGPTTRGAAGGFTLLEMMLAISVLLIAVMAAMSTQASSMNLLRTSEETTTAMSDLHVAMEELLVTPQVANIPVLFPAATPIPAYTNLNLPNESIVPTYPGMGGGPVPDPLEIVLTMTWNDWRGRPRQTSVATMVTQ